ncbi:uncharacterized protein TRIADDRAFT_57984 [Trichoplax adhaerens]|uniref:DUF659 domain-containing protein n=2 Tax=Trichoplax adhaerens TaxID=10228 RepID=B3S2D6_TRIAD|nr:predicted protein [Trichoplax adhaerens]EDV23079.1 predicted protein [Trichoplax adhaerens]|eukprot:XP_002113989.1 predicted protein [Trichoplax adhaerens]
MDGKPERMVGHVIRLCKKIPDHEREKYCRQYAQSATAIAFAGNRPVIYQNEQPKYKHKSNFPPLKELKGDTEKLNLDLLRALISAKLPISSNSNTLGNAYLSILYAEACRKRDLQIKENDCLTMLWDGWTDASGSSIYTLSLLYDYDKSDIFSVREISHSYHTAENMYAEITTVISESNVTFRKIKCLLTNTGSVMLKLRRLAADNHANVIALVCALHVIDTICQDVCRLELAKTTMKGNYSLMNFIQASNIWFNNAGEWENNQQNVYPFQSLCITRWHLMIKVCLFVRCYENFLMEITTKPGTSEQYPVLSSNDTDNQDIATIYRLHFTKNEELIEILKPIGDVIELLKDQKANIADIYLQIILLHVHYKQLEPTSSNQAIRDTVQILSKRFNQYLSHSIYILCLFFWPKYRDFAVSRRFNVTYIAKEVVNIAKSWRFNLHACRALYRDILLYKDDAFAPSDLAYTPLHFWKATINYGQPIKQFTRWIYKLKGHAALNENSFFRFSNAKPIIRNERTVNHLQMYGTIESMLYREIPDDQRPRKRKRHATNVDHLISSTEMPTAIAEDEAEVIDLLQTLEKMLQEDNTNVEDEEEELSFQASELFVDDLFDLNILTTIHEESNWPEVSLSQQQGEEEIQEDIENFTFADVCSI